MVLGEPLAEWLGDRSNGGLSQTRRHGYGPLPLFTPAAPRRYLNPGNSEEFMPRAGCEVRAPERGGLITAGRVELALGKAKRRRGVTDQLDPATAHWMLPAMRQVGRSIEYAMNWTEPSHISMFNPAM